MGKLAYASCAGGGQCPMEAAYYVGQRDGIRPPGRYICTRNRLAYCALLIEMTVKLRAAQGYA